MHTPDIEAEITLLSPEQGGRQNPALSGYRPQHKVSDDYLASGEHHYIDCEAVSPGQTARGTIKFITPEAYPECLWVGREIEILEGSRIVGRARVTKIFNEALERKDYEYDCGARAGQKVRLKRTLALRETDQVHNAGEIWQVEPGIDKKPRRVVLLRKPNGHPHLWTGENFWDWFELVL